MKSLFIATRINMSQTLACKVNTFVVYFWTYIRCNVKLQINSDIDEATNVSYSEVSASFSVWLPWWHIVGHHSQTTIDIKRKMSIGLHSAKDILNHTVKLEYVGYALYKSGSLEKLRRLIQRTEAPESSPFFKYRNLEV